MKYLLEFDLVKSSYLFDGDGLMTKPSNSDLCSELEKHLHKTDYLPLSKWKPQNTASITDVMRCLCRMCLLKVKTFGDLCSHFLDTIKGLCNKSNRIEFVFDTYVGGSVNDCERTSRCSCSPIDLNKVNAETQLPVTMDSFWASTAYKAKLQGLLRSYILENPKPVTDIIASSVGLSDIIESCRAIFNKSETSVQENIVTEEADIKDNPTRSPCSTL